MDVCHYFSIPESAIFSDYNGTVQGEEPYGLHIGVAGRPTDRITYGSNVITIFKVRQEL